MNYEDEATPREKKISRAFAIGLHLLFLVLIVFGVSWQKRASEPAAVVDLWSTMAPPRQDPPRQESPLKLSPRIEKEPTPPPPKPEVKAAPKPDIALKDKLEKERKLKEREELEKKKLELDRKKEEEAKKSKVQQQLETKKKDEEKRKLEQALAQEAEAKRVAAEKEAATKQAAASAQSRSFNEYISRIQNKIKANIVEPPNLQGNPRVEFDVVQIPGGEVLSVRMTKSSGVPAYDAAVERAIIKASPLPPPPEPSLFVRELHLNIRPKE